MSEENRGKILTVGVSEHIQSRLSDVIQDLEIEKIDTSEAFESFIEATEPSHTLLILCGHELKGLSIDELAQSLGIQNAHAPIFYLTTQREGFQREGYIKNGFTDAFLFPTDFPYFKSKTQEILSKFVKTEIYRPVRVLDLHPGKKINFDIALYMPMNKKYIKICLAGDEIDEAQFAKLSKHQVNALYVPSNQLEAFYTYSAECLIELGKADNSTLTETEKKEKIQHAVRDLFANVFNTTAKTATIEAGKEILLNTKKIVEEFIMAQNPEQWYQDLKKTMGDSGDSYSHSSNVSTYAALFSMALGKGQPEELAMAGLFHDLGINDLPLEIQEKKEDQLTEAEWKIYQKHPELSVNLIKQRKLIVPPSVLRAVAEHHERWNGRGYPNELKQHSISIEGMILAFADQFDELTRVEEGKKQHTPLEAIEKLKQDMAFPNDFLSQLKQLFITQAGLESHAKAA